MKSNEKESIAKRTQYVSVVNNNLSTTTLTVRSKYKCKCTASQND